MGSQKKQRGVSDKEIRRRLESHPPSCKLVAYALSQHESLTRTELAEVTLLSGRTIRYALNRLTEDELIESRRDLEDPHHKTYQLVA